MNDRERQLVYIDTRDLKDNEPSELNDFLTSQEPITGVTQRLHLTESVGGPSGILGLTATIAIHATDKVIDVAKDMLEKWLQIRKLDYEIVNIYDHNGKPALKVTRKKT